LASFKMRFLLSRDATLLTDLGISFYIFDCWRPESSGS
jgi:hypothetical protein